MTFILRITSAAASGLAGVVERVKTGEKRRFCALEELGPLLMEFASEEDDTRQTPPAGRVESTEAR